MQKVAVSLICAVAVTVTTVAAPPVATVTAPSDIKVSGSSIPGSAAASVPVNLGDVVTTTDSPAFLRFDGRGVLTLNKRTSVKVVSQTADQTMICLLQGSYHYKFEPNSKLTTCREEKPLATLLEGDVAMSSNRIPLSAAASGGSAVLLAGAVKPKSRKCPDPDGSGQTHGDGHDCNVNK